MQPFFREFEYYVQVNLRAAQEDIEDVVSGFSDARCSAAVMMINACHTISLARQQVARAVNLAARD